MIREAFLPCPRCGDPERVLLRQRIDGSVTLHWYPQQSKRKDTLFHGNEWNDGELMAAWALSDPIFDARD